MASRKTARVVLHRHPSGCQPNDNGKHPGMLCVCVCACACVLWCGLRPSAIRYRSDGPPGRANGLSDISGGFAALQEHRDGLDRHCSGLARHHVRAPPYPGLKLPPDTSSTCGVTRPGLLLMGVTPQDGEEAPSMAPWVRSFSRSYVRSLIRSSLTGGSTTLQQKTPRRNVLTLVGPVRQALCRIPP